MATYPVPTLVLYDPPPTVVPYRERYYYRYETCYNPATSTDRRRGNSPSAQAYLRSRLSQFEYWCAWRIVLQESGWRPTALNWQGACGFPQSYPCSKMADWIAKRHPGEPPLHLPGLTVTWSIDWRAYPNDQLDWMIAYVRGRYGSFYGAAAWKFGYRDSYGVWHKGHGWYCRHHLPSGLRSSQRRPGRRKRAAEKPR